MRKPIETDPRATMPTRRITDKAFVYRRHEHTDIRATFDRIRAEQQPKPANVRQMKRSK